VRWHCNYHVVFIPKYGKRAILGPSRRGLGKNLRELREPAGFESEEGHALADRVHLCLSIGQTHSVADTVDFVNREICYSYPPRICGQERVITGFHSWAPGCGVSTMGLDEVVSRPYIRSQEEEDRNHHFNHEGLSPSPYAGLQ